MGWRESTILLVASGIAAACAGTAQSSASATSASPAVATSPATEAEESPAPADPVASPAAEAEDPPAPADPVAAPRSAPVAEAQPPVAVEAAASPPAPSVAKPVPPPPMPAPRPPSGGLDARLAGALGALAPATQLAMKVTSANGAFDAEAVMNVLRMVESHLQACSGNVGKGESTPYDKPLSLTFQIHRKGITSGVALKGTRSGVSKCVVGIVRKLQFPDARKKTSVAATVTFSRPSHGIGGLGLHGKGLSGGGVGIGSLRGSYGGIGYGRGRAHGSNSPGVRIAKATTVGPLDKNIIRRLIRRNLGRIRFCYERQLLRTPKLSGTTMVNFEISPQGVVQNVESRGLDPAVDACVAHAMRTIKFPKPQGGGVVKVSYPFVFTPIR